MQNELKNVEKIKRNGIFKNYIFKTIPLAFDESMSYYETLCGLLKLLRTQEEVVNNNADALIELQEYVDNYFSNLDVQEEINNKLDSMVESGELNSIIQAYLEIASLLTFNTVADMKQSDNLVNGSFAYTYGFYNISDGGSSKYKIRTITNQDVIDESLLIALKNTNLVAELIIDKTMNTKQIGLKGDQTDETDLLQKFFDLDIERYIINDGHYITSKNIKINSNSIVDFSTNSIIEYNVQSNNYFILNIINQNNIVINNAHLIGNLDLMTGTDYASGFGFNVCFSQNIVLNNCTVEKALCEGFYIGNSYQEQKLQETKNIYVENCKALNVGRNGFTVGGGENIIISNCYSYNVNKISPGSGIDIEAEGKETDNIYLKNVRVENFTSEKCIYGVALYGRTKQLEDIKVTNHLSKDDNIGMTITLGSNNCNVEIIGSTIINSKDRGIIVYANMKPSTLLLKDIIIDGHAQQNTNAIGEGCIQLSGLTNDYNTLENITIDNLSYKNTNSQYDYDYLINQQNYRLDSLTLKNTNKKPTDPKLAFFNPNVTLLNCEIEDNDSTGLLNQYNFFNIFKSVKSYSANKIVTISTQIPDGKYTFYYLNNEQNKTTSLQFSSAYTIYKSGVVSNTLVYSTRKCSYCNFIKNGSTIMILDTDMIVTNA